MPPVVAIVGRSKVGKTTLIEKLIPELASRGHRVATVKHTYHDVAIDEAGKDSRRHIEAGSKATIISSPGRLGLVKPVGEDASLAEVLSLFSDDYDIIIVEGYKSENVPKIEVYRQAAGARLENGEGVIAVATDDAIAGGERRLALDDFAGLATLIEEEVIGKRGPEAELFADGQAVPLSGFLQGLISRTLTGIARSLHGVGPARTLKYIVRRDEADED